MNTIDWHRLIHLNKQNNFINNIFNAFHQNIDENKLNWLNRAYNDIFSYQIFIDEINKSKYLKLDRENRRVIRKGLNVDAQEFIPHSEFIPEGLNIHAEEFIPLCAQNDSIEFIPQGAINIAQNDSMEFIPHGAINIANAYNNMELLVNSMLRDLIN
jgi:hypothetical protein